jgi:hypothetical protein
MSDELNWHRDERQVVELHTVVRGVSVRVWCKHVGEMAWGWNVEVDGYGRQGWEATEEQARAAGVAAVALVENDRADGLLAQQRLTPRSAP